MLAKCALCLQNRRIDKEQTCAMSDNEKSTERADSEADKRRYLKIARAIIAQQPNAQPKSKEAIVWGVPPDVPKKVATLTAQSDQQVEPSVLGDVDRSERDIQLKHILMTMDQWHVRKDGKYYDVQKPGAPLSRADYESVIIQRIKEEFSANNLSQDVVRQLLQFLIKSCILVKPSRYADHRGYFGETYSRRGYAEMGIDVDFVQDNHSMSRAVGTLRGLHFQAPPCAQGKLIHCGRGTIFDVALDIRRGSPTYGQWEGYELSAENGHQLYVPVGFAHGFVTLEPDSEIVYKCTDYYAPETEGAVRWDSCSIDWPLSGDPILSEKDLLASNLADFDSPFVYGENS